jgi:hypothetical protein
VIRDGPGETYHTGEYEDRVGLVPVDDDPIEGLREAVADAFEGESVEELRTDAIEQVRRRRRRE